jgi:hypothetical protein
MSQAGSKALRRRSYLQAMGVDSYISRRALPGAAPSRKLAVVALASPAQPEPISAPPVAPPVPERDSLPAGSPAPSPKVMPPKVAEVKARQPAVEEAVQEVAKAVTAGEAIESFTVAAVMSGGWLWLEEIPQPLISREQVQLIQSMVFALKLPQGSAEVNQFDWPIHRNTQLDLGQAAAQAGLAGFVTRKIEQGSCQGVVLLGDKVVDRIDAGHFKQLRLLRTVSALAMLSQPGLKRQAWRDLQALAGGR